MDLRTELAVKGILSLLALLVVLWRWRRPGRLRRDQAGPLLTLTAVVAVAAWFNFGTFHGDWFVHRWEQFHYVLGSKYFPELGYDGLYVASMGAQMQVAPQVPIQPYLRDLRTNQVVATSTLAEHGLEVRHRFSDARWQDFLRDNAFFLNTGDYEYFRLIRLDHGYNPSPAWTFVARLLDARLPVSATSLPLLGLIDPLLLAVMFVLVFRTYGSLTGCLALVVWGLGFAWRFDWVGGAFLRQDWFAALGAALCMLKRQRLATAGALLGYAAAVRLFPAAFLLGPGVLAVRSAWRRESLGWVARLAAGFGLALALAWGAGCLAGRGPGAWREFGANTAKHESTWLTNNVGLPLLFLYGPDTWSRQGVDPSLPDAFAPWQQAMSAAAAARRPWIALGAVALIALAAAAAWREPPDQATTLGIVAVFALVALTSYYWCMLALAPIRRGASIAAMLLGLSGMLFFLQLGTEVFERVYGAMAWVLLAVLLTWLAPAAWRTRRGTEPVRRAPGPLLPAKQPQR